MSADLASSTVAPPASTPAQIPVVAATAPAPIVGGDVSAGVLAAYQSVQQQTAEAHAAYLNAMAQAHTSFLATAQQGFAALGQLNGASPVAGSPMIAPAAAPVAPVAAPVALVPAPAAAEMQDPASSRSHPNSGGC